MLYKLAALQMSSEVDQELKIQTCRAGQVRAPSGFQSEFDITFYSVDSN